MSEKTPDNPNPKANVGFICYYPLQFYVYKNIYSHLQNAEFIVDDSYQLPGYNMPKEYHEKLFRFFNMQGVYWRKLSKDNPSLARREFFLKYGLLVNTLYEPEMAQPYIRDKKLVRVMYGYAKDPWNFGPWSAYFDLVLSYGPYAQKFLSIYGNSEIVGNPKFDEWFKAPHKTTVSISRKNKKCILYLPTWGDLCALDKTISAVHSLSKEYHFVLKAHHLTTLLRPDQIIPYQENENIVIVDDTADLLPLLQEADIVLSDNSGGIFDAVLGDKPIVLIKTTDFPYLDKAAESLFYRQKGRVSGVATSGSSFEQEIRKPGVAVGPVLDVSKKPKEQVLADNLRAAFLKAQAGEEVFKERRAYIRDIGFSYMDGSAGKRAADKILALLRGPKPPRNFLAEAIDLYVRDFFLHRMVPEADNDSLELEKYRGLRKLSYINRVRKVFELFFK